MHVVLHLFLSLASCKISGIHLFDDTRQHNVAVVVLVSRFKYRCARPYVHVLGENNGLLDLHGMNVSLV